MEHHRRWMLAGASVFAMAGWAGASFAAEPEASNGPAATVEEIVVTAQKREQNLQRVPMTVTALTSSTLTQAGVVDMQGVANLVPALSTEETTGSGNQSYRIRGIGSDPNTPTFEPDVALFIDGVYLPRSGMSVDDLADIARVEVLEGPQSTLYGKNATAGVINIVTKGPSDHLTGSLEGSYSNLDSSITAPVYRFAGSISGPITDRIRGDLSVVSYDQGDSYRNLFPGAPSANGVNRYAVRAEIMADLWKDATLRISAMRSEVYNSRTNDPDAMYYSTSPANLEYKLDGGVGPHLGIAPCADNNPNDRIICDPSPMRTSTFSNVLSATLNSKLGRNNLTSITALTDYQNNVEWDDALLIELPVVHYDNLQKGGTFSQEVRLASPNGDKLEWLTGAYYQHTGFGLGNDGKSPTFTLESAAPDVPLKTGLPNPPFSLGQPGDEGFLNSKSRSTYAAIFGQSTFHFSDQFSLTAGLRAQTEEKHASVDNSYDVSAANASAALLAHAAPSFATCGAYPFNFITYALTPTQLPTAAGCVPINANFDHRTSSVTWNTTGEYHPTKDTMLYVTASRGGKSFGYNIGFGDATPAQREFKDEYVTNYEVGAKAKLFDGRAQVSGNLFYADYHNYQNAGLVGTQFLVNNAEQVTDKGFEANGTFAFGYGFTGNAGVTYVDAKYDKYTVGSPYWTATGPSTSNLSGDSLPLVPNWRTVVGVQYRHAVPVGSLYSRVDWTWQSSDLTNTNLDPRSLQPAYSLVNARLGLKANNGLDLSLWCNNIFNTTYIMQDAVGPLGGDADPAFMRFLGRPRELGVTLRKAF